MASITVIDRRNASRAGFTLIELLVCLTLIGILIAILLPAVQSSRESARRFQCRSNLRQLSLACFNYESQHGMYPPGANDKGFSWLVAILPYLDQRAIYDGIDSEATPYSVSSASSLALPGTTCPSDGQANQVSAATMAAASYAGNSGTGIQASGYNGMFRHLTPYSEKFQSGPIRVADVIDGSSNTAFFSEILVGDGSPHWLRSLWNLTRERTAPNELDEFAAACVNETPRQDSSGNWFGDLWTRGRPWTFGDSGVTWYNHVMQPMQPSCFNRTRVQYGGYTAASLHTGGVHVSFADGHARFIASSIDREVWRAHGSRMDREQDP